VSLADFSAAGASLISMGMQQQQLQYDSPMGKMAIQQEI
jgi:hypothetical protein